MNRNCSKPVESSEVDAGIIRAPSAAGQTHKLSPRVCVHRSHPTSAGVLGSSVLISYSSPHTGRSAPLPYYEPGTGLSAMLGRASRNSRRTTTTAAAGTHEIRHRRIPIPARARAASRRSIVPVSDERVLCRLSSLPAAGRK